MNKICKLFIDENIKIWKKISTKLLIIVILLALIGALALVKFMEHMDDNAQEMYITDNYDWKENIKSELESYKATLANENLDEESKLSIKSEIERCELALKYDVNPYANNWRSSILNEISIERANNNDETRVSKLIEILEKDNFSEYIEVQKQIAKQDLDHKLITQ